MNDKKYIENIILNGTNAEKRALYAFDKNDDIKIVLKKFNLFVVGNFVRFFKSEQAGFHTEMIENYIRAYRGELNYLNIGFRGCAKTSLKKLFDVFTLLNDMDKSRNFYKIMTADKTNSRQIVTDVYNLIVEVAWLYGDVFEKDGKKKHEESMQAFTLKDGRRYAGGTVGQVARGQIQDASRPDFVWFEDTENSETIRSLVKTQTIIEKSDEAIQGMSPDGSYIVTANYISDTGVIEWFKMKNDITTQITPILDKNGKSTWQERYDDLKIAKIKEDAEDWEGDYMCNPESSESLFFDREKVDSMLKNVEKPIKQVGLVNIYREYKSNHRYVLGADVSLGTGLDSSSLVVLDITKYEVVATFHDNNIAPDVFGHEICNIGEYYGNCLVAPENNAVGAGVISIIKERNYQNVFKQENKNKRLTVETEILGWNTNSKTKPEMFTKARTEFSEDIFTIFDEDLLKEMRTYTREDLLGNTTGLITRHYDLLTAFVIANASKQQVIVQAFKRPSYNINRNNYA